MTHARLSSARRTAALLAVCAAEAFAYPIYLKQENADGTAVCAGCTTAQGTEILLTATSSSNYCGWSNYYLDFEVVPAANAFVYATTETSPVIASKPSCVEIQYAWTYVTGLAPNTSYKWQVREWYYQYNSGWYTFNGGAAGFVTGTQTGNKMAFTTAAQTLGDNTCSAAVTVQHRDGSNNPLPVASATPVYVGDNRGFITLYSDAACTTAVTQVTMGAGTSTATFYWNSPQPATHTLVADMSDANWAELANNVSTPGPAAKLAFLNTNSDNVNVCSGARPVQVQDASGYAVNNTSSTWTVTLSSTVAVSFYTDSTCSTAPVTALTIGPGANSANFYSKSATPGSSTWTAAATGLTSTSFGQGTYAKAVITSAPQTITAGNCAPLPAVFQTQDGNSQPFALTAATTFNLYGNGMTFYSDAACTLAISSIVVGAGGTGGQFYWRGTLSNSPYFYASASYFSGYTQYQTVNPGPPSQIIFTNSAATVVAGTCSPQTNIATQDSYGNASNIATASAVVISLSGSLAGTTFYSDSACTLGITSVSIQPARNTASFYWKGNTPGSDVITATGDLRGLGTNTSGTQTQTVLAKLAFTTAALNVLAGACSPGIVIQSQNGAGAAWPATAATTINLSTNSAAGQFFSDLSCTAPITSATLALSTSQVTVYYKDTRAGSPTLSASAANYAGASQGETVRAGTPYQVAFSSAAQVVGRTLCSAAATLVLQDQYGNNTTDTAARTLTLSSSSGAMIFTSDAACGTQLPSSQLSLPANAASVSFYFSDGNQGAPIITASCGGLLSANQTETITLGAATKLAYYSNGVQTLAAGACSQQVTVQSQSANGTAQAVLGDVAVALGSTSAGASFYSGAGCTGPVTQVTIPSGGISANFYWKDTTAGTPAITASTTGLQSATAQQTVTSGAAAKLAFVTTQQSVTAGRCSGITTVRLADAYDNDATQAVTTVVTPTSTSTGATFYSDSACSLPLTTFNIAAASSSASFYWLDTVRGLPTLTVSAAGGITSATQVEKVGGRDQVAYRWYSSAGAALAPESAAAEVQPGAQVHLRLGVLADSYNWKTAPNDATVQGETLANKETVTGTFASTYAQDGVSETLVETKIGTGGNAYRALGDPTTGNGDHAYQFPSIPSGKGAYDLCIAAKTTGEALNVGWSATAGYITSPLFPGWQITSTAITEVCFDLKGQGFAGGPLTIYLRDALRGAGSDATIDTFTIDHVYVRGDPPAYVALERSTSPAFSGAVQVATAELWNDAANADGARLSGVLSATNLNETFVEARPSSATNQQDISSGQQAEWDFAVTLPTGGGSYYYRLVVTDASGNKTGTLESTSAPARADSAATQLVFTTSAQTRTAGSCSAVATVERRDSAGNARPTASALPVALTSNGPVTFYSDAACTIAIALGNATMAAGSAQLSFYWKDTAAGSPTLTATATGLTAANQAQTVTAGPAVQIVFTTAAQNIAPNTCSGAATVEARDQYNNTAAVGAATAVNLTALPSGLLFYSLSACGGAATTQVSIASGASSASFWFKGSASGAVQVTAATGAIGSVVQTENITAGPPTVLAFTSAPLNQAAGACGAMTVETRDSGGNPSPVSANTTVNLAAAPTTGAGFYLNATCTTSIAAATVLAGSSTTTFYFRDTAAGPVTVNATATSYTGASQGETINPGSPAALVITSAPQTVQAGLCSSGVTVQARDTYGNASPVAGGATVNLAAAPPGGFTFYSDAACTIAATSAAISSGGSAATFYFKGTVAQAVTVTTSSGTWTSATQTETINPAPASQLVFTTAPKSLVAGACSGAVTVQSRDAYGNASALGAATTLGLTSSSTGNAFYSDNTCATALGTFSIASGASSATYYFHDTKAGSPTHTVNGTAAGLGTMPQTHTITAAAPSQIAFTSVAQTLVAGGCSAAVTFQLRDAWGNPSGPASATSLPVSSTSTGNSFFTDNTCATPLVGSAVPLSAGQSSGQYYFKDTRAGTPSHQLNGTGFGAGTNSQTEIINPAIPSAMAFISTAQTVVAGSCSSPATLQAQDAYGNASALGSATAINLVANPSTGFSFYSAPGCGGAPVTSVTMVATSSTINFWFKGTNATAELVTATGGALGSANQTEIITASVPAVLAFSTAPLSATAGACAGPVTIETRDSSGNPSPVSSNTMVSLVATPPAGFTFYSASGCTGPTSSVTVLASGTTASFWFKGTAAGSISVGASATGFTGANQGETVNPAAPSVLVFTTAPQTLPANGCSAAVTVQTSDQYGNASPVAASTTVNLTAAPSAGFSFYSASGCSGGTTSTATVASGASAATFYFRGTVAQGVTISISATGYTGASQGETINPAAPSVLAFTNAPITVTAGGCAGPVAIQTRDAWGNVSPVAAATTLGLSSSSTGNAFYSDASCGTPLGTFTVAASSSSASYYFKDTKSGSPTHTVNGTAAGLGTATQIQTVRPAAPSQVVFTSSAQNAVAGNCSAVVAFELRDAFGNASSPGSAISVNVSSTSAGNGFFTNSGCTTALPGNAVAFGAAQTLGQYYFKDTRAGTPTQTVDASAIAAGTATQVENVTPAAATAFAIVTGSQSLLAGQCSGAVTIQTRDLYANASPVPSPKAIAVSSNAPSGSSFFTDASCLTALPGSTLTVAAASSSATYFFKENLTGTPTHTLNGTGAGLGQQTQSHTIAPAVPADLRFATAAQTVVAGACSALATVQVLDSLGNATTLAAGGTVALASDSGTLRFYDDPTCTTPVTSVAIGSGAGSASFRFRDTKSGSPHLTGTVPSLTAADQQQTVNPAAAVALRYLTSAVTVEVGTCSPQLQVQAEDVYGNPSPAASAIALTLASTSTGNAFYSDACVTPLVAPQIAASSAVLSFYFRDTTSGTPTLTTGGGGFPDVTQVETVTAGSASSLVVSGFPSPQVSGIAGTFTVSALDAFGNLADGYRGTVTFQTGDALAALPAAATFTALDAGRISRQATLRTQGLNSLTATDSAASLTGTQNNIQINPGPPARFLVDAIPSPIVAGTPATANVIVVDASGNVVASYSGTVHLSSSDLLATLPADYTFQPGDFGAHSFGPIAFSTPGTQFIAARDVAAPGLTGSQVGIQVQQKKGGACTGNAECGTGICADQVCCATACSGSCMACNLAGSLGTCSPKPDGTTCPDSTYCNGVEVCSTGSCVAGTPVSCVDPVGERPLTCSEARQSCVEIPGVVPTINHDAVLTGAVGIPYRYNGPARIHALGTRPMLFGGCGTNPPELRVDASTGNVSWTPPTAGSFALCVSATNTLGTDQYNFTVGVGTSSPLEPPVAQLLANPLEGSVPLDVSFDGSGSTAEPTSSIASYLWDFGDGAPWTTGATSAERYQLPRGVNATLTVFDAAGRSGTASVGIRVDDAAGRRPPLARIIPSASRGADSLSVDFTCDCQAGDSALLAYAWDFGGSPGSGATASHTFGPGRYQVHLTVVDRNGLTATDRAEIVVTRGTAQPPNCRIFALPPAGVAPLSVRHRATYGDDDGQVTNAVFVFPDATTAPGPEASRDYLLPGSYPTRLLVTDDSGLTCTDAMQTTAIDPASLIAPPEIVSLPDGAAQCGVAWQYSSAGAPVAAGQGPFNWTLVPAGSSALPQGMTVDASTGAITWMPTSKMVGTHSAMLQVTGASGTAEQLVQVEVTCGATRDYSAGCCSASGPGVALLPVAFLVALWLRRSRRRPERIA